ncbi:MAG TPA: VCBS domain-containing protein [Anaerolineales bacterium]|nr:VCBS domain-containing protein [Anaerolineales bacterium]
MSRSRKTGHELPRGWTIISTWLVLMVVLGPVSMGQAGYTNPGEGANADEGGVKLTVPPVAMDDGGTGFTTDEREILVTANVLDNDSDADGDVLAVSEVDTTGTIGLVSPLDGRLDVSFSGDGKVTTNIGTTDRGRALAVQPDGKVILVGETTSGNYNFAVIRYNMDGSLDTSFDGDGKAITDFGWTDVPYGVLIQTDNKIIVGGYANENFGVARYNPDGSLDSSFSEDGKATTSGVRVLDFEPLGVALQPDGKIVLVSTCWDDNIGYGIVVARFTEDGELDQSFGNNGMVVAGFGDMASAHDVVILPNDNILISGYGGDYTVDKEGILLVQYQPDGTLDRSFGSNGSVLTHIGRTSGSSLGVALALQPDNKFVVTGNSDEFFVLARYNEDGSLDESFDEDGLIMIDSILGKDVAIQPNGKIIVAGTGDPYTFYGNMEVHRYNPDGSLDTTFGESGRVVVNFVDDYGYATALGPSGEIYVAGNAGADFGLARIVGSGVFAYNPNQQFDYLRTGEVAYDTFTYTVSDGVEDDTAVVTITIVGGLERSYMPIMVAPPDLYGFVTENGNPVAGVPIVLRFYDGASWSTLATSWTDAHGQYVFNNLASLTAGQVYYARYTNETNPVRLYTWMTREVTSFTGSSSMNIGNFDIANIELLAPAPGAEVPLSCTFRWDARLASLGDSYEFNLFDPTDGVPYFYTAPPLGYVDSYTLYNLPSGFAFETDYVWDMWVYSPDGGTGISYWAYYVSFVDDKLGEATGGMLRIPHTIPDLEAWRQR